MKLKSLLLGFLGGLYGVLITRDNPYLYIPYYPLWFGGGVLENRGSGDKGIRGNVPQMW